MDRKSGLPNPHWYHLKTDSSDVLPREISQREDQSRWGFSHREETVIAFVYAHLRDKAYLYRAPLPLDQYAHPFQNLFQHFLNQYPIYSRKKGSLKASEEVLFDVNKEANGYDYFHLGSLNVSPNNRFVVFAIDTVSRRQYFLRIKDLKTGKILDDIIENTTGGSVWANDNKTIFYTKKNPTTLRSEKIYRHILGTPASEDVEVYHEKDETFGTYVTKSKSRQYIIIGSYSTVSTEAQFLDANNPFGEFQLVQPRERDHEYSVSHYDDSFYILTNKDKAINFKLMHVKFFF